VRQDGDGEDTVQEAIDTCPVNCIQWVDYTELKRLETERQYQEIPVAGFPVDRAAIAAQMRRKRDRAQRGKKH
jgi:ferredoxin